MGMKMLAMVRRPCFRGLSFCPAFMAALLVCQSLSVLRPLCTPASATNRSHTFLALPGPRMTWSVASSTTPSTPWVAFSAAICALLLSRSWMRRRVMQLAALTTLPLPPTSSRIFRDNS